jgi:hypothetical protein
MQDFIVNKLNVKLLNNVSAGASVQSDAISIQEISLYCLQSTWTGFSAVTPLITLYGSNSLEEEFVKIDAFIPTGSTGGRILNVEKAGYGFVKVAYTCVSGSGNLTVSINGKVI